MKKSTDKFSFKVNQEKKALSQDIKSEEKKNLGRPKEKEQPRNKQVGCYLTEDEFLAFKEKLDGRSASNVIRQLIINHIN